MLNNFKRFIADKQAWDMYITGRAGTGKTTQLADLTSHCDEMEIPYVVLAFTHKACGILKEKLPEGTPIATLHSFLRKRPGINADAAKRQHVDITIQAGDVEPPKFIFIDEYSIVGERDLMSIRELQDSDYDGVPEVRVVWLGDPYQLPPVGDAEAIVPEGNHSYTLTKVFRRADGNPLGKAIDELVSFIEGGEAHVLTTSDNFIRGLDISEEYVKCPVDKILLAYTNRRVQSLNAECQGYSEPRPSDRLYSPTSKHHYEFHANVESYLVYEVDKPFGEPLPLNTKYKTLEHLLTMDDISFASCTDDNSEEMTIAYVFGHQDYKDRLEALKVEAVEANAAIERKHKMKPAFWAKANKQDKLARRRAKAWRDFMTFNECVMCLDFAHAMTVHKSQGSTYDTVFLDTDDLGMAAKRDYRMYLRLMYVALSRASNQVITN